MPTPPPPRRARRLAGLSAAGAVALLAGVVATTPGHDGRDADDESGGVAAPAAAPAAVAPVAGLVSSRTGGPARGAVHGAEGGSMLGGASGSGSPGARPRPAAARVTAAPSAAVAPVGAAVNATGRVADAAARPARLQRRTASGWVDVASTTTRAGRYALRIPTRAPGDQTLRVVVRSVGVSAPFRVEVGRGDPRSVAYLTAPAARWDPCAPVRYRINAANAPAGAVRDLHEAVARVSAATGLRFVDVGRTTVVPGAAGKDVLDPYPAGTDLVVAFTRPGATQYLPRASRVLGVGGAFFRQETSPAGGRRWHRIVQGYLVVDGTQRLPGGFGAGRATGYQGTWGQVLMHELGHVVGLDHPKIKDPEQIMYFESTRKPALWGAGDLVGLHVLGAGSGCFAPGTP